MACGLAIGAGAGHPLLLVPLVLALVLGTADDARPLPPVPRLVAELVIGVLAGLFVSTRFPPALGVVLVTLATAALMNGVNLLDGLDGLCASVCGLSAAGFAVILAGGARLLALALLGALAGFLVYNLPPAKIYLGDGGSYLVGTALALLFALAWGAGQHLDTGIAALALVAVPGAELGFAVLRRARAHKPLLAGDRAHPYDRFVQRGWGTGRTVAAYTLVAFLFTALAVAASHGSTGLAAGLVGAALIVLFALGMSAGFTAPGPSEPTDQVAR